MEEVYVSRDHDPTVTAVTSGYTPGPWVSFDRETVSRVYSAGNDGSCLADVHSYTDDAVGPRPNRAARRANARLISAAPDFRAACVPSDLEDAADIVEAENRFLASELRKQAAAQRAAIAKTTGAV